MFVRNKALSLVLTIILLLVHAVNVMAVTVTDDYSGHWAKEQINRFMNYGLISGYEDGYFRPDAPITRAEFISIINKTFEFSEKQEISFKDIKEDDWYYSQVRKATQAGYANGYLDGTFKPNNNITRVEAAVMISKALHIKNSGDERILDMFYDKDKIPEWGKEYFETIIDKGFMKGYPDGTCEPEKNLTRAEAVTILSNATGKICRKAGVYGNTEKREVIDGNLTVTSGNITLQNLEIKGDLILAAGIGEGEAYVDNVTVEGSTYINGGGENSVYFNNTTLNDVVIYKSNGKIRVVAKGTTSIESATVESGGRIEEEDLTGEGFKDVEVIVLKQGEKLEFDGTFKEVIIETEMEIELTGETEIEEFKVEEKAKGINLNIEKDAKINKLTLNAKV